MTGKRSRNRPVTGGSCNVFADLGFPPRETPELKLKAELTILVYTRNRAMGLTQVQAARRLGISQPDVSELMKGRFTGYSTGRLVALWNALEVDIDIVVRPRKKNQLHRSGVVRIPEATKVA